MSQQDRKTAMAFYELTFNQCRPREAVESHVGDEYIQHNPDVGDGRVVEHRDVLQKRPDGSPNDNSMF